MSPEWPLIGRDQVVASALDLATRPGRSGVLLNGPAGVGKTRVAREILDRGRASGFVTAQALATRATSNVPLGALSSLLPDLSDRSVNPLSGALAGLDRLAGGRPLMLNVDDAHLLDDFSSTLLLHVALTSKAFLVITARDEGVVPESVHRLWRDGFVERFDLEALDHGATADVISKVLPGEVDRGLVDTLYEVSGGNPLILHELVTHSLATGAIEETNGAWRLEGRPRPSPRLTEIVNDRLSNLDPDGRRGLALLARGEPLSVRVIDSLAGDGVAADLERRQLATVTRDERRVEVRLVHPIYGEVIAEAQGVLESDRLVADLADSLRSSGARRRGDLIRLATWELSIGRAMDPGLLAEVARQTHRASDFESAVRFGRASWEELRSTETGMLLAYDLLLTGRNEEADDLFASVLDEGPSDLEIACLAGSRAVNLVASLGRFEEAGQVLTDAESRVRNDESRTILRAERATHAYYSGDLQGCIELGRDLSAVEGRASLLFSAVAEPALIMLGRHLDAARLAAEASERHLLLWDTELLDFPPLSHDVWRVVALGLAGQVEEACNVLETVEARAAREEGPPFTGRLAVARGWVELLRGRPAVALSALDLGAHLLSPGDTDLPVLAITALRSMALSAQGRGSEALEALGPWIGKQLQNPMTALVGLALCSARAVDGDLEAGRAGLVEIASAEMGRSGAGMAFEALAALVSTGGYEAAEPLLDTVVPMVDGPRAPLLGRMVKAVRTNDGEALGLVAEEAERLGLLRMAVEAALAASAAMARTGSGRKAAALRQRAATLAQRADGLVVAGLDLHAGSVRLTPRELDIARLAAQGVSSREIAERLYLSVRTVNNHLQHIYQKLGIRGRNELRGALEE